MRLRMTKARWAACILIGVGIGLAIGFARPWESTTDRAYRRCSHCGLDRSEVDLMIDDCRHSVLDRARLTAMWEATFDAPDRLETGRKLCLPCAEAILDAAGAE